MIDMKRTTVYIDDVLLREIKKFAAEKDLRIKDILNDALKNFLYMQEKPSKKAKFKQFHLGKVGKIKREDIYEKI